MPDRLPAHLGDVQRTLFFPLGARIVDSRKKRPLLSDPKAAEQSERVDFPFDKYARRPATDFMVLRAAVFDGWVRSFLTDHPAGTVVEIGAGLGTRFDRLDNATVHWCELDLPDVIDLRRELFAEADRRSMIAASFLDHAWMDQVAAYPPPYCFVAEGVLVYLPEEDVARVLTTLARRFPGSTLLCDIYGHNAVRNQRRRAARSELEVPWQWAVDDPQAVERLGWRVDEATNVTRPPADVRRRLPIGYRAMLTLIDPLVRKAFGLVRAHST